MSKTLYRIICSRSGLEFEAETRRFKVHPQISYYTAHKDADIRYPAIQVIERGKKEGWNSIEKFLEEIKLALNPPPAPKVHYHLECAWVAKITGYHEKFEYEREFLKAVETNGRFKRFLLEDPGLYQSCYKSAKGNETRQWWLVADKNSFKEIKVEQALEILGANPLVAEKLRQQQIRTNAKKIVSAVYLGAVGQTVKAEGSWVKILALESRTEYEDEDGLITDDFPGDTRCVAEYTTYTYWTELVEEEVANRLEQQQQAEQQLKERGVAAIRRIAEIALTPNRTAPKDCEPRGTKISFRDRRLSCDSPYLQIDQEAGLLWTVFYNGRDGDDWEWNNYGHSIASNQPLTPDLDLELTELIPVIYSLFPEAIATELIAEKAPKSAPAQQASRYGTDVQVEAPPKKSASKKAKVSPTLAEIRLAVRQTWEGKSTDEIKKKARKLGWIPKGANMRLKATWIAILRGLCQLQKTV
jgi:hypothetical protein